MSLSVQKNNNIGLFVSLTSFASLLTLGGCNMTPTHSDTPYLNGSSVAGHASAPQTPGDLLAPIQEEEIEVENWADKTSPEERENLRQVSESIHSIPVEMNARVKKWIDYFSQRAPERFQRFLSRGAQYREIVENVLEENGLPAELYYLAMIESGYQNHATSRAQAVGVWQFIRGTGRRYNLMINRYVDERRDPIRATEAAVRYLRDLYNVFGSWHLAMAGYNAGEMRVMRAIFKAKTRDFWKLVQMKALPRETRNYVPKFLAAVEIGSNPEKYGFQVPTPEKYPDLQAIELAGSLSLKTIASTSGIALSELKRVNPHLRRGTTPPGRNYQVWVPLPLTEHVRESKTLLAKKARTPKRAPSASREVASQHVHKVRRGENLTLIARRYGQTVARLKQINGLRRSRIYPGMRLKITAQSYRSGDSLYYRVRRGDNLSTIAGKFGMSISSLKRLNGLRSSTIYVGSRLKVAKSPLSYYRVRRGDNLSTIARKFGMSVAELKKLNGLRSNRIHAGARFKVRASSSGDIKRYRVRRGDNLTRIAQRFGASIDHIKRLNSLRGSRIYPGQVLVVNR